MNEEFVVQEIANAITVNLFAAVADERWIDIKYYAKLNNISTHTVRNYTSFLRTNNAISGEGKMMRYDKFFNFKTGEYTIPEGTRITTQSPKRQKSR